MRAPRAIFVVLATSAGVASAQPVTAQAEALFREGRELLDAGKIAEACAAFDASERLDPSVATVLNQANCRELNGQLATAWGLFLDAERQTRAATDDVGRELNRAAASRAARIEPHVPTIRIEVPADAPEGLAIHRGNDLVDRGAWGRALPIDGGSYTITASAPNRANWSITVTVTNRDDTKSVVVNIGVVETAAPIEPHVVTAPPQPRSKRAPVILGASALVLAATAVGFELWGERDYDRAKNEPDDATQSALWETANHKRYAAEGLGIGAAGCVGVAIWLLARGDAPAVVPIVEAGRAAVRIELRW